MHIPQTKIFGGKRYQLYGSKGMMNKGKAKNTAAQLKLEGKLARVVPFMSDRQAEYLVYYREK